MSLSSGGGDYAIDWGTLALVRPDVISVPQALAFTGFAYLYMCICFYLLFAGLILLYTLAYDLWDVASHSDVASEEDAHEVRPESNAWYIPLHSFRDHGCNLHEVTKLLFNIERNEYPTLAG